MTYKIISLVAFSFLLFACKKTTNVNLVDSPDTGQLKYKIVDYAGLGVPEVTVLLYKADHLLHINFLNPERAAARLKTDQNGVAAFSDLSPDNYLIIADSAMSNRMTYKIREHIQVVAGIVKEKETKASDFSASLNLTIISKRDHRTPVNNFRIAAVTADPATFTGDLNELVNNSAVRGITNAQGFVTLKIPSEITCFLVFYNGDRAFFAPYPTYSFYRLGNKARYSTSLYVDAFN